MAADWQPTKMQSVAINDKALAGGGFTVYMVRIDPGTTTDQSGKSFVVAGASSLPSVPDLWDGFCASERHITADKVDKFADFLRHVGYVQIEQTVQIMMGYH